MVPPDRPDKFAPLASMEDLSVVNTPLGTPFGTPLSTPGPSPRAKHRWSHRSSLGTILDEEEDDIVVSIDEDTPVAFSMDVLELQRGRGEARNSITPMSTQLHIDRLTDRWSKLNTSEPSSPARRSGGHHNPAEPRIRGSPGAGEERITDSSEAQRSPNSDQYRIDNNQSSSSVGQSNTAFDDISTQGKITYGSVDRIIDSAAETFCKEGETTSLLEDEWSNNPTDIHRGSGSERIPARQTSPPRQHCEGSRGGPAGSPARQHCEGSRGGPAGSPARQASRWDRNVSHGGSDSGKIDAVNNNDPEFTSIADESRLAQFLTPRRSFRQPKTFEDFLEENTKSGSKDRYGLVFCALTLNSLSACLPFNLLTVTRTVGKVLEQSLVNENLNFLQEFSPYSLPILVLSLMTFSSTLSAPFKSRWFSRAVLLVQALSVLSVLSLTIYLMTVGSDLSSASPYTVLGLLSVLCLASGALLTEMFGTLEFLPSIYTAAIFIGMGLGVCICVLCQLLSLIFATDLFDMAIMSEDTASIYVLILVLAFFLASADLYLAMPLSNFYLEQHMKKRREERMRLRGRDRRADLTANLYMQTVEPASQNRVDRQPCNQLGPLTNMFLQSSVSFLVFPFVYQEVNYVTLGSVRIFPPVFSYLPHSLMFCLGCLVASLAPSPPSYAAPVSLLRVVLVPLFLLANLSPDQRILPVILWDWSYVIIVFIWSFLGGYCISLASFKSRSKWMCTMFLFGSLCGSILSASIILLVQHYGKQMHNLQPQ